MKKIRISFLFLILISNQNFAQGIDNDKFNLGLNVGANLLDLKQEEFFNRYNGILSYSFGISFEFMLNEKVSLLSNINYDRKIMESESFGIPDDFGNPSEFTAKNEIKYSYINIPVFIRYYFGNNNRLNINAGGFYNYVLNVKDETRVNETSETINPLDINNSIQNNDYGVLIALGYQFNLNNNHKLAIDLRNEIGLKNITKNPTSFLNSFTELKTNTIKLMLNWKLPI
jgi:hypothetical protein